MNIALVLIVSIIVLIVGYFTYGRWLEKQWGVDPDRPTPAHEMEDGMDYVPAKTPVLLGHHFSSIAGAGPINGPIQAAAFGYIPVLLWVLLGGIFFGAVHDFGALFASIRHKGQTIGEVIADSMGPRAKKLFLTFGYLTLILVVAAFSSIVANTFKSGVGDARSVANESTAIISIFFILLAIVFGILVYRFKLPILPASVIGIVGIIGIVALGLNWHPIALSYNAWMWIMAVYILIASVTPVWILLQPRDYLSSFLLYFMIAVSVIGIIGAAITGNTGDAAEYGAFLTWESTSNGLFTSGTLFPALFVTIACGAISGFHSLVASGTTSKQLNTEKNARPVAYGSMLIECALAVVSLCAVAFCWKTAVGTDGVSGFASPTAVFATGISSMIGSFTSEGVQTVMYSMLILAVSVFCLTSLDTATRLARYMFQEFWLSEGETLDDAKKAGGIKAVLTNPYFSTVITVVLGVALGMTGYSKIWPLFGAANQLLAALGLLAVCTWLGEVGKNNKMFYIPMVFMLLVTITSLCQTIASKFANPADGVWSYIQAVIAILLVVLAVVLAVMAFKTLVGQAKSRDKVHA